VPLFVMASGAVLLGRRPDPARFYRRRFAKLLPAALVFVPAYYLFAANVLHEPVTVSSVLRGLASGRPYNHLYFLPVIGGLYAVTPLLQAALRGASRSLIWAVASGLTGFTALEPLVGMAAGTSLVPNVLTWWIPFVGYFVLGHALATARPVIPRAIVALATMVALLLSTLVAWWATVHGGPAWAGYMENYNAITVVPQAICVFVLLRSFEPVLGRRSETLAALAALTFGVYLIHLMIATTLFIAFPPVDTSVRQFLPIYVGTLVISFALCAVIARTPIIRRAIGL
jgi:surface polysaccharide O-acyltransferase-like enzyme